MHIRTIKGSILALGIALSSANQIDAYRNNNDVTPGKIMIGACIGAGIAAAVYWLASWLRPSDMQVCQESETVLYEAQRTHALLIGTLENLCGSPLERLTSYEKNYCIQNCPENVLRTVFFENPTICASTIGRWIRDLTHAQARLNDRIPTCKTVGLSQRMARLLDEIHVLLQKMIFLHGLYTYHCSYFELLKTQQALLDYCGDDFSALQAHPASQAQELRMRIVQKSNAQYPYTVYIQTLESTMQALEYALNRLEHSYPSTRADTYDIVAKARHIRALLITDPAYTQEKNHRQMIALEQERNNLLQQQVYAQERQARAQEQQADAMARQARAEEQQARIARELLLQEQQPQVIVVV